MHIEITEEYLAGLKRDLEHLKTAQEMARNKEAIPVASYRIDMQSLLSSGIVALQEIIETVEQSRIRGN